SFTTERILNAVREEQPVHPRPAIGVSYVAPNSDLERTVAEVWGQMLGIAEVGIYDNFFELGGNSLIGLDVIARLRKVLGIDTIPAYILYEAPTVSAMAQFLDQSRQQTAHVEARHDRGAKRHERQAKRRAAANKD
ncbi:MAG: hypothetical protein JOZ51_19910, partial [Chloroflexi bacterium]|nr:hypothetical protein [Chloroflexota bacterium]